MHDGLVDADDEQREVLEQAWQIACRPRLTLVQGGGVTTVTVTNAGNRPGIVPGIVPETFSACLAG